MVADAELEAAVQEQTQFRPGSPHPNADFPGRAGRHVSAQDGFVQVMPLFEADALGVRLSVAGQGKAIVGDSVGAHQKTVFVRAAAQAGTGGDLGVEIPCDDVSLQADQIHAGLGSQGQTVTADGGRAFIGGGCIPGGGAAEIVAGDNAPQTGQHLRGGDLGAHRLGRRSGRCREPDRGRGLKRGWRGRTGRSCHGIQSDTGTGREQ